MPTDSALTSPPWPRLGLQHGCETHHVHTITFKLKVSIAAKNPNWNRLHKLHTLLQNVRCFETLITAQDKLHMTKIHISKHKLVQDFRPPKY